jgi:hypothetical protein
MNKLRAIFQKNPYLRHYLNILFSIFRTINLKKNLKIDNYYNSDLKSNNKKNKKLLVAGSISLNPDTFTEYLISQGYYNSHSYFTLKCDSFMNACFNCKKYLYNSDLLEENLSKNGPGYICQVCEQRSTKYANIFNSIELPLSNYLTFENENDIDSILKYNDEYNKIKNFKLNGINIGLHAYSATVRFYASPFIENERYGLNILKNYFESALRVFFSVSNLLKSVDFDLIIINHGIYVPQGIIAELASQSNIKTLCFATGYRKNSFMVSYMKSYHFDFITRTDFESCLQNYSETKIKNYLLDRADGKQDWILFHEKNTSIDFKYLNYFDDTKNNIILFTNVLWDADVHFETCFFNSMIDWLVETINYLIQSDNNNLIIRIHPGELKGFVKSRVKLYDELKAHLSNTVFERIHIIDSNEDANSYELAKYSNHIILYGSKLSIELAGLGYKVLVGGPSWTLNKGITIDPVSKSDYFKKLDEITELSFHKKNSVNLTQALKFAHYVFFDRCIELPFIEKSFGDPPIKMSKKINITDDLSKFNEFIDFESKKSNPA